MTGMLLSQAAQATGGHLHGQDQAFSVVSTDTRSLKAGDLFVALRGEQFDGHAYINQAIEKGAAGLLLDHAVSAALPQLIVNDTRLGYGKLAAAWRDRVNPKIIALTGSNGKTTLKEMLAAILQQQFSVLSTAGNLNNDIGVPATLLRLADEEMAVIEMGANHVGEIDYLSRLVRPDVAILNNAGRAHIGEFGSEENIARGKAEIINGLDEKGIFVYHADSQWVSLWKKLAADVETVSFGLSSDADYQLLEDSYEVNWHESGFVTRFDLLDHNSGELHTLKLQLAGRHNAMNATAAFAGARQLGCSAQSIIAGLSSLKPVKGRLYSRKGRHGQLVIDDTYNANPDSVEAAINVLATAPRKTTLVLGDLAELGEQADALLAGLGAHARQRKIDRLLTCGVVSQAAARAFGDNARHFDSQSALIDMLNDETGMNDVILVKGSRSSHMESVVAGLSDEEVTGC